MILMMDNLGNKIQPNLLVRSIVLFVLFFVYNLSRYGPNARLLGDDGIYGSFIIGEYSEYYRNKSAGYDLFLQLSYLLGFQGVNEIKYLTISLFLFIRILLFVGYLSIMNELYKILKIGTTKLEFLVWLLLVLNPFSWLFFRTLYKRAISFLIIQFIYCLYFSLKLTRLNRNKRVKIKHVIPLVIFSSLAIIFSPYGGLIVITILLYAVIVKIMKNKYHLVADLLFVLGFTLFLLVMVHIRYIENLPIIGDLVNPQYFETSLTYSPVIILNFIFFFTFIVSFWVMKSKIIDPRKLQMLIFSILGLVSTIEIPLYILSSQYSVNLGLHSDRFEIFPIFDNFPAYIIFLIGILTINKKWTNTDFILLKSIAPIFYASFIIEYIGFTSIPRISGQELMLFGMPIYVLLTLNVIARSNFEITLIRKMKITLVDIIPFFIIPHIFIFPNENKLNYILGAISLVLIWYIIKFFLYKIWIMNLSSEISNPRDIFTYSFGTLLTIVINWSNPSLSITNEFFIHFIEFLNFFPSYKWIGLILITAITISLTRLFISKSKINEFQSVPSNNYLVFIFIITLFCSPLLYQRQIRENQLDFFVIVLIHVVSSILILSNFLIFIIVGFTDDKSV